MPKKRKSTDTKILENCDSMNGESITLPFARCSKSHKYCIICKSQKSMVSIPTEAKMQVFINSGVIIQGDARCCKRHLSGKVFKDSEVNRIEISMNSSTMNSTEISDLLNSLRVLAKKKSLDFYTPGAFNDLDYRRLIGISEADFSNLFEYIKSKIRNTSARSAKTCLAILLMKLRTGMSKSILSTLFGLSRRAVGKAIHSARQALMEDFVPHHLGMAHITRDDFIKNHTRDIAK